MKLLAVAFLLVTITLASTCQTSIDALKSTVSNCATANPVINFLQAGTTFTVGQAQAFCSGASALGTCSYTALQTAGQTAVTDCVGATALETAEMYGAVRNASYITGLTCQFINSDCFTAAQTLYASVTSPTGFNPSLCTTVPFSCIAGLRSVLAAKLPFNPPTQVTSFLNALSMCTWSNGHLCATELQTALSNIRQGSYSQAISVVCESQCLRMAADTLGISALVNFTKLPCVVNTQGVSCYQEVFNTIQSSGLLTCTACTPAEIATKLATFTTISDCLPVLKPLMDAIPGFFKPLVDAVALSGLSLPTIPPLTLNFKWINFTMALQHVDIAAIQADWATFKALLVADIRAITGINSLNDVFVRDRKSVV